MSKNDSLGKLCMALARPYVIRSYIYPIRVSFRSNLRFMMLRACKELCYALGEILDEQGYHTETIDRTLSLVGTMKFPVNPKPWFDPTLAPTATLVVLLPVREKKHQHLERLLPKHRHRLLAACSGISDIEISYSFGCDGCHDSLLEDPFDNGATSRDLVFVSLWDLKMEDFVGGDIGAPPAPEKRKNRGLAKADSVTADDDVALPVRRKARC